MQEETMVEQMQEVAQRIRNMSETAMKIITLSASYLTPEMEKLFSIGSGYVKSTILNPIDSRASS